MYLSISPVTRVSSTSFMRYDALDSKVTFADLETLFTRNAGTYILSLV